MKITIDDLKSKRGNIGNETEIKLPQSKLSYVEKENLFFKSGIIKQTKSYPGIVKNTQIYSKIFKF